MKKKLPEKPQTALYRQKPIKRKKPMQRKKSLREARCGGDTSVVREDAGQRAPRCLELFAGAGGLAIAAPNAGFEHDAVLEFNHDASETIRANQRRGYELENIVAGLRAIALQY